MFTRCVQANMAHLIGLGDVYCMYSCTKIYDLTRDQIYFEFSERLLSKTNSPSAVGISEL